ncbi:Zinc finger LIM type [Fasciola gigantica]|uniref:Zinc finger LIM type n=1 Tax=Fasciola gigantica TaxID=46835 RepID=A0A504Y8N3_FASGI|nr:Zinc finger LIM type [Fasciola gigantica]
MSKLPIYPLRTRICWLLQNHSSSSLSCRSKFHSLIPVSYTHEIPQSDTIMRPIHRSSPTDQSTSQIKEPSREDQDKITQSPKIPLPTSHVTPLVTSLRSPLSTQMVDTAEASASQLNTPSQAEDSTTSRSIALPNTRHVDITGTEPTYMTLVTTDSQQNDTQADYQIKLPPLFRQDMISTTLHNFEPAMSGDCTSISHQAVDSTSLSNSQSPSSPLPPPPSLPLPTSPSSCANAMQLQNLISLEFHPLGKFVDPDADPSTPAHGHMYEIVSESGQEQEFSPVTNNVGFRTSDLPSPPPPQFFSPESEPVITPYASFDQTQIMQANSHLVPNNVSDRSHSSRIRPDEQNQSLSVIRGAPGQNSVSVLEDLSSHPRLNSYTDSHIPTVVTLSPELSIIPPPAPSSPLLPPLGIHRTRTRPMRVVPADESTELIIDDLEGDKDPLVYKRHEPHPRLYAPPPLPKTCRSDPPPQPPRVPMNRFINQKQKCVACTRELGSGDLMLIESMSLYYHLACFVCSRCGVALSDGLSNTDVRIRCGQLYCNDCYPSRHSKGIQQSGGNSHRVRNTVARTNASLNFSDRRSRPRSQCSQPRGSSTVSGLHMRYNH